MTAETTWTVRTTSTEVVLGDKFVVAKEVGRLLTCTVEVSLILVDEMDRLVEGASVAVDCCSEDNGLDVVLV